MRTINNSSSHFTLFGKGNLEHFRRLWEESVAVAAATSLKLVAVSFPDLGEDTGLAVAAMNGVMDMDEMPAAAADGVGEGGVAGDGKGKIIKTATELKGGGLLNVWQVQWGWWDGDNDTIPGAFSVARLMAHDTH